MKALQLEEGSIASVAGTAAPAAAVAQVPIEAPALQPSPASASASASAPASLWVGLVAVAAGHLAVDCCTGIWPVYKTIAHLDLAIAGLIATVSSMVANSLQVVFGILADRGLAKSLLVGGALLAGCVTLVPYVQSYPALAVLVLLTSIGSAAFHPVGTGSAAALSQRRTGVLVALFLTGGYIGYSLSQIIFTTAYRGMHGATAILLPIPILAAMAVLRFVPAAAGKPQPIATWARNVRAALRPLSVLFVVQVFASAISNALIFLLPDLLHTRGSPAWVTEGGGHFALVLGGALSLVPAGHAADKFGARRVLLVSNLLTGVLLALVLRGGFGPVAILVLLAAFGACNCVNSVVAVSEGTRMLPGQTSGVSALLMGFPWLFAAFAPGIAGTLADPSHGGSPASALSWMAICIPLALLASLFAPGRHRTAAPRA